MTGEAGPQALSDDELSGLRGGFTTPTGLNFGFGAIIRSYIDDKLALQTQLTWTPTGAVTQQVRGDAPGVTDLASAVTSLLNSGINLSAITGNSAGGTGSTGGTGAAGTGGTGAAGDAGAPAAGAVAGGASNTGGAAAGVGDGASHTGAPAAGTGNTSAGTGNTSAVPVAGGIVGGVALVDSSGATALIHTVTAGQIQSLIINNASNRNLRQDIELNLYLPDLAAMQAASSMQQRASQMTYDLNTSLVGSIR